MLAKISWVSAVMEKAGNCDLFSLNIEFLWGVYILTSLRGMEALSLGPFINKSRRPIVYLYFRNVGCPAPVCKLAFCCQKRRKVEVLKAISTLSFVMVVDAYLLYLYERNSHFNHQPFVLTIAGKQDSADKLPMTFMRGDTVLMHRHFPSTVISLFLLQGAWYLGIVGRHCN